jgi:hypothetical protein
VESVGRSVPREREAIPVTPVRQVLVAIRATRAIVGREEHKA